MPDRVVALQLLSSCWLAVILPPLPAVFCFSAIYSNARFPLVSSSSSSHIHQGRKFGGYRIVPKTCKVTTSLAGGEKETAVGVCMFNYECARKEGTVVGSCVDGFLYGACCKLPAGMSASTLIDYHQPDEEKRSTTRTTTVFESSTNAGSSSMWTLMHNSLRPAQIQHPPAETYLLYINGTAVQDTYSDPEDYLNFIKPAASSLYLSTNKLNGNNGSGGDTLPNDGVISIQQIPSNISPGQIFDLALSLTTKPASTIANGEASSTQDRSSTLLSPSSSQFSTYSNRPYVTTKSTEQPQTSSAQPKTTLSNTKFTYHPSSSHNKHHYVSSSSSSSSGNSNTNNDNYFYYNSDGDDENLIRIPTLSVDNTHHKHREPPSNNESIGHILWLLNNQTKSGSTNSMETVTQPTPSLYTWLSVQDVDRKNVTAVSSSGYYSTTTSAPTITKPFSSGYQQNLTKFSTLLPSTTIHHITGPSFQVTPEVKITPKPQSTVAESAPTVIVLTPAHENSGAGYHHQSPPKNPSSPPPSGLSGTTTSSSGYNVSYHYPQSVSTTGSANLHKPPSTKKPYQPTKPPDIVHHNILITSRPPTQNAFDTLRPASAGYISKPIYQGGGATSSSADVAIDNLSVYSSTPVKQQPTVSTSPPVPSTLNTQITSTVTSAADSPSVFQTTVITTAKPIISNSGGTSSTGLFSHHHHNQPTSSNNLSNLVFAKPTKYGSSSSGTSTVTGSIFTRPLPNEQQTSTDVNSGGATFEHSLPPPANYLVGGNVPNVVAFNSSNEDFIAFPPVRNPNVNLTASQQEKPAFTATTTFGDEEIDSEVTPQFVVDKTLEDKVHVFVERIVQSLQGNFEDLEKVLISGESTGNVTVSNGPPVKKPSTSTKRPLTGKPTRKPPSASSSSSGANAISSSTASVRPPLKTTPSPLVSTTATIIPSHTTTATALLITNKRPTKKPTLATPVLLFQPSSSLSQTKIKVPTVSTTVHIPTAAGYITTSVVESASGTELEPDQVTTLKNTAASQESLKRECGIRPLAKKNGRIVGGKGAAFGEWPWQVLVREATWLGLFTKNKCGGVLITNRHVITAAHCQPGFLANLVAVFGEYDISGEVESRRSVNKNVKRVIVHRQYDAATFENDIALLELESPVQFDAHIVPICMPEDDEDFTGRMATVTGWGRLKYAGGVPSILQEVQVPVMENRVCQEMFQTAGHPKVILNSFICAGYANGQRDSCEGDSGGPLMVEKSDGRWVLVATVSHGIKCAAPYLPGVYMRTTYYKPWLQTITGMA